MCTDERQVWEGGARRVAMLALLATGVLFGSLALTSVRASAAPARYVFEICDGALPSGGTVGAHFVVNPGVALVGTNTCAQGGSLSIQQTGHISATYSFWSVPTEAPPGGHSESITISGNGCFGAGIKGFVEEQGWPLNCQLEQPRIFHVESLFGGTWVYLGCDGNYTPGCDGSSWISARWFATTEVDPKAPTLANVAGSLLAGNVARGHQSLSASAHDQGGGLTKVWVSVNGTPAAETLPPSCNTRNVSNASVVGTVAYTVTPCPEDMSAAWDLNTQSYPFHNGTNTVSVCASDFATLSNPNTTCSPPKSVEVDNSCAESAVVGGEQLSAEFTHSNAETITVGYGEGATVAGALANNAGDPVPGATLCVKAQTLGSAGAASVGTVKTDATGHYSYEVPPGPNREVMIGYRHDSHQIARNVRYFSHTSATLHCKPGKITNGDRVRLWGWVPGPSADRRVVVLQASPPGSKRWLTFRKAISRSGGAFVSGYRFAHTTVPTTYRIRALVPEQEGYPWQEGASKPVRVRVRPR